MDMGKFAIKAATRDEFAVAVEWAAREGWNPGLDDLAAFHAADPEGFLMGYVDDRPVSSISVVRYGQSYGFLGFYIVVPELRGAGYGLRTWNAGLEHLTGRAVGLDGVVAQQDNYRKSGFVLAGRNVRYTGSAGSVAGGAAGEVETLADSSIAGVVRYDSQFFHDDRAAFMAHWAHPKDTDRRWGMQVRKDGDVQGFGVVRACRRGYKIGPLFAENRRIAETLFAALCQSLPGDAEVSIDVPEDNPDAVQLARSAGFEASFETARMYMGAVPKLPIERTFGISTFELG